MSQCKHLMDDNNEPYESDALTGLPAHMDGTSATPEGETS